MKKILLSLIIMWAFFIAPTNILADYFTPSQPAGALLINKLVKSPNGSFVENLGVTDPHFLPEQEVMFRIEVKNVGNKDLVNVEMKDKLPDWVDFVQGPGTFDKNYKTISFTLDKLTPNDTKTFDIKAKVK